MKVEALSRLGAMLVWLGVIERVAIWETDGKPVGVEFQFIKEQKMRKTGYCRRCGHLRESK